MKRILLNILLLISPLTIAQTYPPAIDFTNLMNIRFYEETGGFMIETLPLLFPPAGDKQIEFEIAAPDGKSKYKSGLRLQRWDNQEIFAGLSADGPGIIHLKEPGDFVMNIKVDGEVISRLPFKLVLQESNDPYNPSKSFLLDGAWKSLGYFSYEPDRPDYQLKFNWWSSLRELPGKTKSAKVSVHLLKGESEIAKSRSTVVVSQKNWQRFSYDLITPAEKKAENFTINSLTKEDGAYSVVLKADGKEYKTYPFTVSGGKITELPRNDLGYTPHYDFLATRVMDISSGSNSSYKVLQASWVESK